jgi:hypothetical protein
MTMSEAEACAVVEMLTRAYPTYPLDPKGVNVYVDALVRCPYGAGVTHAAVSSYILNEPWMPKVSELLDVIEVEAAGRSLVATRALPPGGERPASREERSVIVDVLKTVLEEMPPPKAGDPPQPGYADRFDVRARELGAAQGVTLDDDGPRSFSCVRCFDSGFEVETNSDGVTVCIPCPCIPARYERWRGGHYEPGHSCSECTAIRKGQRV